MGYEHIRYEVVAEGVVQVTLDRPQAANALSLGLFAELDDAVGRIDTDDDVRVWMLTGAPRADGRPWFTPAPTSRPGAATTSVPLSSTLLLWSTASTTS